LPHSEVSSLQHSDLNGFLYADLGTERNGMSLSVMSALARLGKDPWREAERLASLPNEQAIDRFTGTISNALSGLHSMSIADTDLVARRLITLLPDRARKGLVRVLPRQRMRYQRVAVSILIAGCTVLALNLLTGKVKEWTVQPVPIASSLSQPDTPPGSTTDLPIVVIR
jgi:hypothetical protein